MKKIRKICALLLAVTVLMGNVQAMDIQSGEEKLGLYYESTEMEDETKKDTEKSAETENQSETEEKLPGETEEQEESKDPEETEQIIPEEATEKKTEADTECETESENGTETESETKSESESETESETESESETEEETDSGIELFAMTLVPSGTLISNVWGWQAVSADTRFSSEYRPVKFYPGISSMELFNFSDQVVIGTTGSGRNYLYPKSAGQGGKFGAIYRKVLYYNHRWYDLKMTVTNYTTQIDCDGSGKATSYPFIVMFPNSIEWRFNQALGGLVMKCEFLENTTGNKTAVNTRFQWWDVDGSQRFGMKAEDGWVAGRYYYSGSPVYIQSGQTIAGVNNLEVAVGQGSDTPASDPRYCVTYELANCSTYYMAIGPRDHIDDDNYSYSKSRINSINEKLANGQETGADKSEALRQTDSSLAIIDTLTPEKTVSSDGYNWTLENRLSSVNDSYWYRIRQFIPWQDSNAYYQWLQFQDYLPTGVIYDGNFRVIREEDGKDMTGNFVVEQDGQLLKITPAGSLLADSTFYGYHYLVHFYVHWDLSGMVPQYQDNTAVYTVKNTASILYQHNVGNVTEKWSNEVTTTGLAERKEQEAPIKYLDQDIQKTEKDMKSEEEEILFTVQQKIPEKNGPFQVQAAVMTDLLEDCLELREVTVERQRNGESISENVENTEIQQQEKKLTVKVPVYEADQGAVLKFCIKCSIKKKIDLSAWKKKEADGSTWIRIPNEASVALEWNAGVPSSVVKNTNQVQVKLRLNRIKLIKEIQAEDIVWAHGNPTFTFGIRGTDANGRQRRYYQTVEFRQEDTPKEGKVRLMAEFEVPAGNYEAFEEKTMRYQLKEICEIVNGTKQTDKVSFGLENGGDGAAVFCNEKTTDQDESHTAFVENVIKAK